MPSDRIKRGQKRKAPANDDNQHSYDYADLAQGGTVELISTTVRPGQRAEHHREVLLSGYVDPQQPPSLSSFESGAFLQSDFLNVDYFSGVHEAFVESLAEEQESEGQKKEKKRRYVAAVRSKFFCMGLLTNCIVQDEPLLEWIPLAQEYLEEMLRWEGRGHREDVESCDLCHDTKGQYRCKECAVTLMLCQACCVSLHKHAPLHRVEVRFLLDSTRHNTRLTNGVGLDWVLLSAGGTEITRPTRSAWSHPRKGVPQTREGEHQFCCGRCQRYSQRQR